MNEGLLAGVGTGVAGSRGRFEYQLVEASATICAPPWAVYVSILAAAGGGGGGGGRLGFTTNAGPGAGGGGAGSRYIYRMPLDHYFTRTRMFTVTIGAGGTAGAGGTTDGAATTAGGLGGTTTIVTETPNSSTSKISFGITLSGGIGGNGGATTNVTGGGGGTGLFGSSGTLGGTSSATLSRTSPPDPTGMTGIHQFGPSVNGGYSGAAKSDFPSNQGYGMFYAFGTSVSTASSTDTSTQGMNGEDPKQFFEAIVTNHLNRLVAAPKANELWFTSATGGGGGRSGTSSGTAVSGGVGGSGWRGSGGGGGGGAGVSGAVGGNGGTGGNGYAIFFWEEY